MRALLLAVVSFGSMELISYAVHRWVMHGVGMVWHRSHHAAPVGRFERNDLYPVCFAAAGVALFAIPALGWVPDLFWVGVGVTAYGTIYLFVHDLYIHRRVPVTVPRLRYLEWLRSAHGDHHRRGGEPYGMLLPLVRDAPAARRSRPDLLDRSVGADRSEVTR